MVLIACIVIFGVGIFLCTRIYRLLIEFKWDPARLAPEDARKVRELESALNGVILFAHKRVDSENARVGLGDGG